MFHRLNVSLVSNPICEKVIDNLDPKDFRYYDKDGFELNFAEQKYYAAMGHPIWHDCLNHHCWQEPWFELKETQADNLILDHCMLLHRAKYIGAAREQLKELTEKIPTANLLLQTKQKWGLDFALDAVAEDGTVYEVIHIEYDATDYDIFKTRAISVDFDIKHRDWIDAANQVWKHRDQWRHLRGFEQNHWKSKFLLGWNRAEAVEKAI